MNENLRLRREIESIFGGFLDRECLYVPAARVGIYAALSTLLSPGDRVLITPQTDDVVLFVLLAAGVRPVIAPVSPADGNIAVDAVPEATWDSLQAVMTTNLYGIPDRIHEIRRHCEERGLVLIEDAAHALHTEIDGRPVGTFGDAAVFSLSKHPRGVGGVLAFADPALRPELERLVERLCGPRPVHLRVRDVVSPAIGQALGVVHLRDAVVRMRRRYGPGARKGHRMPLLPERLRAELRKGSDLPAFDDWVGFDLRDYRWEQPTDKLRRTVQWLHHRDQDRERRIRGIERLLDHAAVSVAVRNAAPTALFRVPLLVEDREWAGRQLEAVNHPFTYVYAPPLDEYAGPEFVDPSPRPAVARWWARHAAPVDPLLAPALPASTLAHPAFTPADAAPSEPARASPRHVAVA